MYRKDDKDQAFNSKTFTNDPNIPLTQRWNIYLNFLYGNNIESIKEQIFEGLSISSEDIEMPVSDLKKIVPDLLEEKLEEKDGKKKTVKIATFYLRSLEQVLSLFNLFHPEIDEDKQRYFLPPDSATTWEWIKQNLSLHTRNI
jgi:hypothetical protein